MVYEVILLKGQPIENSIKEEPMETYAGYIKTGELIHRYQIPQRDFENQKGYQRLTSKTRVNKLVRDLKKRVVDLPTSLLLSVRRETGLHPTEHDSTGQYILSLPENGEQPFHVVDGQHRLEALRRLVEEEQDAYWVEYMMPVIIFFNADDYTEMVQFHTVNANAKSVPTDLALDLLKTRAAAEGRFLAHLNEINEGWKVTAQTMMENLSERGVWSGRIRFSTQSKGNTLIKSNSFASCLKRVLEQDNFDTYSGDQQIDIIDAYWRGIARALPTCFKEPEKYNIQSMVGVQVFHDLLPTVLTLAIRFGTPVDNPHTYKDILSSTLHGLTGYNALGYVVTGADFWKTGKEGASVVFSSGAGRRSLGQRLKAELLDNLKERIS